MNSFLRGIPSRKDIPQFDSAAGDAAQKLGISIDERAALAAMQDVRKAGMAIALQIADDITNDALGDDLPSERMDSYMVSALGVSDGEKPDELMLQLLSANIADAMSTLGCSDDLIADCFNEDTSTADSALENAAETIISNLPEDGDPLDELANSFIYGFSDPDLADVTDEEAGFDSMNRGKKLSVGQKTAKNVNGHAVVYKAVKAVVDGKIKVKNTRIAGTFRQTAAQKAATKKARLKSMTGNAINKRKRSRAKGQKANIYK